MSIITGLQSEKRDKLVIPYTGKMFRSSISKDNKALCFVLNKGYVETDSLDDILRLLDDVEDVDVVIPVGGIDKVRTSDGDIVYRQRLFFKSLKTMLSLCRLHCLYVSFPETFHVTVNSVLNCVGELTYLERYSRRFGIPIDTWLKNCCLMHMHFLLKSVGMYSELEEQVNDALRGWTGYLDRSPFLISNYSIDTHTSSVFIEFDRTDRRLFTRPVDDILLLTYGYTTKNVEADIKSGYFDKLKKRSLI